MELEYLSRDNSSNTSRDRKCEQEYVEPRKETAVSGHKRAAQKQISLALVDQKKMEIQLPRKKEDWGKFKASKEIVRGGLKTGRMGWGVWVCNIRSFFEVHLKDPAKPKRCCGTWGRTYCCGMGQCKQVGRNTAC